MFGVCCWLVAGEFAESSPGLPYVAAKTPDFATFSTVALDGLRCAQPNTVALSPKHVCAQEAVLCPATCSDVGGLALTLSYPCE